MYYLLLKKTIKAGVCLKHFCWLRNGNAQKKEKKMDILRKKSPFPPKGVYFYLKKILKLCIHNFIITCCYFFRDNFFMFIITEENLNFEISLLNTISFIKNEQNYINNIIPICGTGKTENSLVFE